MRSPLEAVPPPLEAPVLGVGIPARGNRRLRWLGEGCWRGHRLIRSEYGYPSSVLDSHNVPEASAEWGGRVPDSIDEPNVAALRVHLAQLRHERGWSYDELAARSGVGRSTLVTLESGSSRRNPDKPATTGTLVTWFRIAQAFDVDLGDLVRPLYESAS